MAGPDGREISRQVSIDLIAQADDDSRGKPSFRLGYRRRERGAGPPAEAFERQRLRPVRGHVERSRTERARNADPVKVIAIWPDRRWFDRAIDGHVLAGLDH